MSEFSINLPPRLPTAQPAPNVLTAVIPDPPRALTLLDTGTIIKGQVQGRDTDGLLIVLTDKGALKLSTPANIATGSQVTLEVRNAGDRLQVIVLSVDGQPIGGSSGQPPRTGNVPPPTSGSTQPPPTSGTAPPPPAPVAIVGSFLHGTIVQAAPDTLAQLIRSLLPSPVPAAATPTAALPDQPDPASAQGAGGTTQKPGESPLPNAAASALPKALATSLQADVRTKIEALFSGTVAKAGQVPVETGQLPSATTPTATSATAGAPPNAKLPIALTTGAEVRLRLVAITAAPGQPGGQLAGQAVALPTAGATPGNQHVIAGRIIGYTPAGNAVMHSPLGAIILQGSLSLPVGAQLSVAVEPMVPAAATTAFSPGTLPLPQLLLSVARGWPSLADVIGLLRQTPGDGEQLAALARLPQAGPKLAAGILAAMQAIRAGDAEALLGALAAARSGVAARDEGARKVRQELAQLSPLAQERPGIDWRCCFIPILDDGTVRQINMFYRRDRKKDRKDGKDDKAGTRFIVEVDMSRMGPFQFDGLVREKQFDLMVRSRLALPPKFRQDIAELFQEALSLGEYRGGLVFQQVKAFPVSPLEEIEKSATSVSA